MQSLSSRLNNISQYQTQNLSGSTFSQCSETDIHLTLSVAILVFGLLANTQLLIFAINQLKLRKTPDKVLILNLATVDIAALSMCLPMHINDITKGSVDPSHYNIQICHWGFTLLLVFFFSNLSTLATIAIDRFEALTRFQHQRKFRIKTAAYGAFAIWALSLAVAMVTCREQATTVPFCAYVSETGFATVYKDLIARVVIITVFVTTCCSVITQFLLLATRHIRKHRNKMEEMFGPREGQQKIDFTKICIAFSFAYIMTWVPFGVVATVYTFLPSHWTFCAYQWTKLLAFNCFVIIPIVYMIMDKRVLEFVRRFLNCSCAVENKQTRAAPRGRTQAKVDTTDKKTRATTERCKDEETIQEQPQETENKTEIGNQQHIVCYSNMTVDDMETISDIHRATNSNSSMREEPKTEAETNEDTKL